MYQDGDVISQDYKEAVRCFLKAAGQGHVDALFELATCYRYGEGVTRDHKEAARWNLNLN